MATPLSRCINQVKDVYTSAMSSLYLDHFGLSKPPFEITPDLDFFFSGGRRGDILSALLHVAAHDEGIITLVAEVGSGKTLLARLMISRLGTEVCAVYLANPCFSRDEIIVAIARDLGLTNLSGSIEGKLAALQQELLHRHAAGQRVLLVIDEAHAMPVESLEEVRLLSNLETGQHKLVNIMLFGQPELDDLLADPRLRQVRDRVIHRFELLPLAAEEARAYVDHRLRSAGWQGASLFSPAALKHLIKASDGRARRINLLADKALLAAYAQGDQSVEMRHAKSAMQDLPLGRFTPSTTPVNRWPLVGWSLALAMLMTGAAIGLLGWYRSANTPTAKTVPLIERDRPLATPTPAVPVRAASASAVSAPAVAAETRALAPAASASEVNHVPAIAATPTPSVSAPIAPPPLAPIDTRLEAVLARTHMMLKKSDLTGYTIQLVALHSTSAPASFLDLATEQLDSNQIYALHSVYRGKTYMSFYFGNFESINATVLAIETLPTALKSNHPMVRSWSKIKQEQAP